METKLVRVNLANGAVVHIETTVVETEQDVAFQPFDFEDIAAPLEGLATTLRTALAKAGPNKTTVELGLEVGVESGKLTALLVKGSAKVNLKVTLQWGT